MASLLLDALRAGRQGPVAPPAASRVAVLAGAGGALGAAVLEQALALGGFAAVRVLAQAPVAAAMRGFQALTPAQLVAAQPPPDTGFIVFDRERDANGREAAFLKPQPAQLLSLGRMLHAAGVQHLVVVLPHAPALLPHALREGLATLDEQGLATLGFEQLVLVRPAQAGSTAATERGLKRLAQLLLSQLHWMVPQQQQAVRAVTVASFVARLAHRLPAAPPGTRVAPPELLWRAAQGGDVDALIDAWLRGRALPPLADKGAGPRAG